MVRLLPRARAALWALALSAVLLAAVTVAVVLTVPFLEGEGAIHARQHLGGTAAGAIVGAAIAVLWQPRRSRLGQLARLALAGTFWIFALAQLGESFGAFGYDEFNIGTTNAVVTGVHDFFNGMTTLSILFVLIAIALSLIALADTARRSRRDARAEPAERAAS